jgi:hypothetical protein
MAEQGDAKLTDLLATLADLPEGALGQRSRPGARRSSYEEKVRTRRRRCGGPSFCFFLGGAFRNLDDLNDQLRHWLDTVANPRVHATTNRSVNEASAEERASLKALPIAPYRAVLRLERRASHDAENGKW